MRGERGGLWDFGGPGAYRFVFEPLPLDEEVGAAVVVLPADFVDGDAAEASPAQGQPSSAGVIPSHDHCSHTRITVTAERGERDAPHQQRR